MPVGPEMQRGLRIGVAALLFIDSAILLDHAMNREPVTVETQVAAVKTLGEIAATLAVETTTTTSTTAIPPTTTIPPRPAKKPVSRSGRRTAIVAPQGLKPARGETASIEQLDALGDCESGDHDGLPPYTPIPTTDTGNGFKGSFQWRQSSWDKHVLGMHRNDLVGVYIPGLPYEVQREVTQGVPIPAWENQFPRCYDILHRNGII